MHLKFKYFVMRDHLADVIIPIIHHIKTGVGHTEAIAMVAETQGYSNASTCYERCTRHLNLDSIHQFVRKVNSGEIAAHLIRMFPDRQNLIERELN